jgi:lipopolysaccharide assembly outer membrane protein LptD (OstA)
MQTKDARVYRKMKFSSRTFLSITAFIFGIIMFQSLSVLAQKKVHLKQADEAKRGKNGNERFDRLLGNVILVQNTTTIYCDSAHLYKKRNSVEAFGHVHIIEGDSIDITGSRLEYDGNTKKAKLRNKVVFKNFATATL